MADSFVSSDNISVFPSVFRVYNPSGKFTNETNFANIVKSIVDKDSYVVSYDNTSGLLKLVIFGYYFIVEGIYSLPRWAAIKLATDTVQRCYNLVAWNNSINLDDPNTGNFMGLYFSDDINPPSGASKTLQLKDNNGNPNFKKISSNSIFFVNSEGGDSGQSITQAINEKQDKLNIGRGLTFYDDSGISKLGIDGPRWDRLEKLTSTRQQIIDMGQDPNDRAGYLNYFDDSGKLVIVKKSIGNKFDGNKTTLVYVNSGKVIPGNVINYSTNPPGNAAGSPGDIWIQYTT